MEVAIRKIAEALERIAGALERLTDLNLRPPWQCPGCGSVNPQQHSINCNWTHPLDTSR